MRKDTKTARLSVSLVAKPMCSIVRICCLFLLLAILYGSKAFGQSPPTVDSLSFFKHPAKTDNCIALGVGALGLGILALPQFKQNIQQQLHWNADETVRLYDDQLRYAPLALGVGLSLLGMDRERPLLHSLALGGLSYVLSDFVVYRSKKASDQLRPNGLDRESFPSQHTAMAFVAATLLHRELGQHHPAISIGGYACAAWVGYARIARNRHYTSDVLVGAAVGTLVTNITYMSYDYLRSKKMQRMHIQPILSSDMTGVHLSYLF